MERALPGAGRGRGRDGGGGDRDGGALRRLAPGRRRPSGSGASPREGTAALAGGGQAIKDIAKAARDLQAGRGTKHPDLSRFADWDEVRAYAQQEEDGKRLQVFVRLVDRHGPDGLIDMISRLTPEGDAKNPPQLTISTAHKAKGREWDTVRIAGDFRGPATDPETGEKQILGVGRLSKLHESSGAEVAVVISDQFQRKGLGSELLNRLLQISRDEDLDFVAAQILRENPEMQRMVEKVGFSLETADESTVRAVYNLRNQVPAS